MDKHNLAQYLMESTYSKSNIRRIVHDEIVEFLEEQGLSLLKLCSAVDNYRTTKYSYESKNKRVVRLGKVSNYDLVIDVITAAISTDGSPQILQSVVAKLAHDYDDLFDNHMDSVKTLSEVLAVCSMCGLYIIKQIEMGETYMVIPKVTLDTKAVDKINRFKYLPPMVSKPKELTSNEDNTHLSVVGHVILGKSNQHNLYQAIDSINIANSVKLSLCTEILQFEEVANKELDTADKKQQFSIMTKESTKVYNEILELGNEFHLTWKFDKRGRKYSQGYHINIQSTGYKKACINLAKKEIITGV